MAMQTEAAGVTEEDPEQKGLPCPFLDRFPAEIRNRVYELVITSPDVLDIEEEVKRLSGIPCRYEEECGGPRLLEEPYKPENRSALAATCKQIRHECKNIAPAVEIVFNLPVLHLPYSESQREKKAPPMRAFEIVRRRVGLPDGAIKTVYMGRVATTEFDLATFARLHNHLCTIVDICFEPQAIQHHRFALDIELESGYVRYFEFDDASAMATADSMRSAATAATTMRLDGKDKIELTERDVRAFMTMARVIGAIRRLRNG